MSSITSISNVVADFICAHSNRASTRRRGRDQAAKTGTIEKLENRLLMSQTTGAFDFGVATSPVAVGYTQVTPASTYSAGVGYGWLPGPNSVQGLDTGINFYPNPDPNVTRDFNYTVGSTFAVNVPTGLYDVTLVLGDAKGYAYPQTVSFGGQLTDTLTTGGGGNPAVVSKTYIAAATAGQLDVGLGVGAGGTYAVIDGLSFVPDTSAFAVTGSAPAAVTTTYGPLSHMSVTFNHPVGGAALVASNYSLAGPGNLSISNVAQANPNTVNLTFSSPTLVGAYTLTVGAGVQDIGGSGLAAPVLIGFTDGVLTSASYDFGSATSPLANGYTQITPATVFSSSTGFGWLSGSNTVSAFDTGNTSFTNPDPAVTRDFNYTVGSTFAANVANGLYDVTLTLGDARGYTYPQSISFGGVLADTLTTGAPNAVITKTYTIAVNTGQLDVGIASAAGGTYGVIDGLSFAPDTSAFGVTSSLPASGSTAFGSLSQMSVTFNHPIGASALVASNYSLSGPGNLTVVGAAMANATTVNLTFSNQTVVGAYTLTVGTGVQDVGANPLASAVMIPFTDAVLTSAKYDFGTASSPIASGYTQVTPATLFNATAGFGWLSGNNSIAGFDTGNTSFPAPDPAVTRDFDYSVGSTFAANVANGLYDVTVTLGDARGYTYPQIVSFPGVLPDAVTTGGTNAVVSKTYTIAVTTGQLDVSISAAAGGTYGVIDGLSFNADTTPFAVTSSIPAANGVAYAPVTQMSVTFNHPIGASALVASNYSVTGSGGITVSGVTQINSQMVTLTFSAPTSVGSYSLNISANVQDISGNAVAATSIPFSQSLLTSANFDFGTPTSPIANGYTQIAASSIFNSVAGFGWVNGVVMNFDTGVTNIANPDPNLVRDFNYTQNATFGVNLANGQYNVTLTLGDARDYSYTMAVNFQNGFGPQDTVTTGGTTPIVQKTYVVTVINGQIVLNLSAGGGGYAVIDGMTITPH